MLVSKRGEQVKVQQRKSKECDLLVVLTVTVNKPLSVTAND